MPDPKYLRDYYIELSFSVLLNNMIGTNPNSHDFSIGCVTQMHVEYIFGQSNEEKEDFQWASSHSRKDFKEFNRA